MVITMSPELAAYLAHLDKLDKIEVLKAKIAIDPVKAREEAKRLRDKIPPEEYAEYRRGDHIRARYLKTFEAGSPERQHVVRALLHGQEYTLEIWHTTKGGWGYSQGRVYAGPDAGGPPLAVVTRNYSSFPFLFVAHPNGHAYLVCGWDYQGQTVIELDTGARRDSLSPGGEVGGGFCWASMTFEDSQQMLIVDGCHWACPYEYRFYDFSQPLQGLPEIPTFQGSQEVPVDADPRLPTVAGDEITTYQTRRLTEEEEDQDIAPGQVEVAAYTVYRREGSRLVQARTWVSEAEQAERLQRTAAGRTWQEAVDTFKRTDPLYLHLMEATQGFPFDRSKEVWIGQTYDGWCPIWRGRERRYGLRLAKGLELEFGEKDGPIHLWAEGTPRPLEVWHLRTLSNLKLALRQAMQFLEARSDAEIAREMLEARIQHPELWGAQR